MRRAPLLVGLLLLAVSASARGSDEPRAERTPFESQAACPLCDWQGQSARLASPGNCLTDSTPAPGQELASKLAPAILRGSAQVPELWLAQRSIDREWGPSEDSLYRTIDVQGWKSEGFAMVMSAAVPGTGQLYVGEGSGWFFLAAEAVLWVGRVVTRQDGSKLSNQAAAFVGDPTDSASTWSFARYASATGGAATRLEQLWTGDRDSYYQTLANDPSYRAGFSGSNPDITYESYRGINEDSQDRYRQSRRLEMATWVNHTVAAFDALRAAHFHNLPLRRALELQLHGTLHRGAPEFRATLLRRF